MAPGLNREFISEKWRTLDKKSGGIQEEKLTI